jgi:hypothetical protein
LSERAAEEKYMEMIRKANLTQVTFFACEVAGYGGIPLDKNQKPSVQETKGQP